MFPKPSRTARKLDEAAVRKTKIAEEKAEKAKVRLRDRVCRVPLCGCTAAKLATEVSHDRHKGMGSKDGVSTADQMVLLCRHRHRDAPISRHAGTLKATPLDPAQGYNGPVAWWVDAVAMAHALGIDTEDARGHAAWVEVAREVRVGQIGALTPRQGGMLTALATMRA